MALHGERNKSPPAPGALTLEFVDDSVIQYCSCDDLHRYACRDRDAYYELYHMWSPEDSDMVHILNFLLYMLNYVN